jgi:TRAP transporter TAXI family solute receptor
MHRRHLLQGAFATLATWAALPAKAQEKAPSRRNLLIGLGATGATSGAVGQAVCNLINAGNRTDFACKSHVTAGSTANVAALTRRIDELAFAQTDTVWAAVNGKGEWNGKPAGVLRVILPMFFEPISLVVRQDARIKTMADLKGKRIGVGLTGSEARANALDILGWYGLQPDRDVQALPLELGQAVGKMVTREIDGFFYVGGHPSDTIARIAISAPLSLVPIDGPQADAALKQQTYYIPGNLPGRLYRGVPDQTVKTVGVRALLMTHDGLPAEICYELTKLLVEQWETLRAAHGSIQPFQPAEIARQNTAPYHPGAQRYLRERKFL